MSEIVIQSKTCWMCGGQKKTLTTHHCISQTFKPKNNVLVPVCSECHDKINEKDISAMYQFTYKIMKNTEKLWKQVGKLNTYVENNFKIKVRGSK